MMYCGLNNMRNTTLTPMKKAMKCMITHEQIQQMFDEEIDDDESFGFEQIFLILVLPICWFDSSRVYWC